MFGEEGSRLAARLIGERTADVALWTDLEGLTIADRYELRAHLATGGMAAVYRGWDHRMERPVAVKLLRDDGNTDAGAHQAELERFRREARAVAALRSPYIVEVYDFIADDGRAYLIMELVDGPNLKQRILDAAPLPVEEALTYAIHVCRALAKAHAHGYIHRDIKPQNILLHSSGVAKLTDFGIVHVGGGPSLTASGLVLGTADYIAPEQAQGLALEPASDLYALGIVLFEMLTASVPFAGATATAVALRHTTEPLPPLRLRNPDVPPLIERIVQRAAAKDVALRFATAAKMEAALTHALAVTSGTSPASLPAPVQFPFFPATLAPRAGAVAARRPGSPPGVVAAPAVPLGPEGRFHGAVSPSPRSVEAGHAPPMGPEGEDRSTRALDTLDEPDALDELDWHDVALLLSTSPWHVPADALADAPGELFPSASPPVMDLARRKLPAVAAFPPLDAVVRLAMPSSAASRLVWTAGAMLLLLVAIVMVRMLLL